MAEEFEADVDEAGRLILPAEYTMLYGLNPGAKIRIGNNADGMQVGLPATHLAKVNMEPTNRCNLYCATCIRNIWDEPLGEMSYMTFAQIVQGLSHLSPPPVVLIGGLGEPLAHHHIGNSGVV